eukprot:scaffold2482_cov145-Skeletonema_dohrnii-CCMP3373.AAC.7
MFKLTFISPWAVLETPQLIVAAHLRLDFCKTLRIIFEILRSGRCRCRRHGGCGCPPASMRGSIAGSQSISAFA